MRRTVVEGFRNVLMPYFESTRYASCQELCEALEVALFQSHAESQRCGPKYKSKYRTLQFNLKDAKNSPLRQALLQGEITPARLMTMTAAEMANEEVKREIRRVRENSVSQLVMDGEGIGLGGGNGEAGRAFVKKTHKGEDYLPMGVDEEGVPVEAFDGKVAFNVLSRSEAVGAGAGAGTGNGTHAEAEEDEGEEAVAAPSEAATSSTGAQWQGKIYITELGRIPAVATFVASSPSTHSAASLLRFLPHNLHVSGRLPIAVASDYAQQIWNNSSSRDVLLFALADPPESTPGMQVADVVRWLGENERWAVVAHDRARGIRDFYIAPARKGCVVPPTASDSNDNDDAAHGNGSGRNYCELVGVLVVSRDGRAPAPVAGSDQLYDPHYK